MDHVPPTSSSSSSPRSAELAAATRTHTQGAFLITTRKLPISRAGAIDALTARLGIPVPEMIFGDNLVRVAHPRSGWSLTFAAAPALDAVDKTGRHMLRVAHARDWERSRQHEHGIRRVVNPFDWTYSSAYAGSEDGPPRLAAVDGDEGKDPSSPGIPLALLRRRDPILFFDDVVLYESELDDNGVSVCSVKLRVHQHRMLLLCRLFMRLDNVLVRIRDTRVYVDFDKEYVIREYTAKETSFDRLKELLYSGGHPPDDITISLRDPNILDPLVELVEYKKEVVFLNQDEQDERVKNDKQEKE